jgi:hypothetical protein
MWFWGLPSGGPFSFVDRLSHGSQPVWGGFAKAVHPGRSSARPLFSQAKVLRQLRARVSSEGLAISDLNSFQTFCR